MARRPHEVILFDAQNSATVHMNAMLFIMKRKLKIVVSLSPAKPISHGASTKAANHSSDGKDGDSNGPDQILLAVLNVDLVASLPAVTDEVLNDRLGRIDHPSVVAKLEHPQHCRKDGVAQEACQSLEGGSG